MDDPNASYARRTYCYQHQGADVVNYLQWYGQREEKEAEHRQANQQIRNAAALKQEGHEEDDEHEEDDGHPEDEGPDGESGDESDPDDYFAQSGREFARQFFANRSGEDPDI